MTGPGGQRQRWRGPVLAGLLILLGGIVVAALRPAPPTSGYLDPGNPGPYGTRALASILAQRGEPVTRAGSAAAARSAAGSARPGSLTLVITSPYLLTTRQLTGLGTVPASVLLVEPDAQSLAALVPGTAVAGESAVRATGPQCGLGAATLAGNADMGGVLLRASQPHMWQCYPVGGHPSLLRYSTGGRTVTVLGSGDPLTNQALASRGDAALALNLLRGSSRVVWLVPSMTAASAAAGQKSLLAEIPLPAYLVTLELAVAVLLAALWRARRLGPLVSEPLPVVVRAAETVEGHGRLYRSRRSRDRAAAVLREAATRRIATRLALPGQADAGTVCAAMATLTGRDAGAIRAIMSGPVPRDDAALVALGRDLDALEGEVRTQ